MPPGLESLQGGRDRVRSHARVPRDPTGTHGLELADQQVEAQFLGRQTRRVDGLFDQGIGGLLQEPQVVQEHVPTGVLLLGQPHAGRKVREHPYRVVQTLDRLLAGADVHERIETLHHQTCCVDRFSGHRQAGVTQRDQDAAAVVLVRCADHVTTPVHALYRSRDRVGTHARIGGDVARGDGLEVADHEVEPEVVRRELGAGDRLVDERVDGLLQQPEIEQDIPGARRFIGSVGRVQCAIAHGVSGVLTGALRARPSTDHDTGRVAPPCLHRPTRPGSG